MAKLHRGLCASRRVHINFELKYAIFYDTPKNSHFRWPTLELMWLGKDCHLPKLSLFCTKSFMEFDIWLQTFWSGLCLGLSILREHLIGIVGSWSRSQLLMEASPSGLCWGSWEGGWGRWGCVVAPLCQPEVLQLLENILVPGLGREVVGVPGGKLD